MLTKALIASRQWGNQSWPPETGPTVAGDDSMVEAIIPAESTVVVPAIEKPVEVAFDVEGTEITTLEYVTGRDWRHALEGMGDIVTGGVMIAKGFASYNSVDVVVGIYDVGAGLHNTISGAVNKNTRLVTVTLWDGLSAIEGIIDHKPLRSVIYDRDR